ncbi:hypothetical protein LXA43DRAFT_318861 [Ganoderma leucocontextum]|nr:hypothetical protein LXA43DRAFT_318861 [Ganoderma leucocontextum]
MFPNVRRVDVKGHDSDLPISPSPARKSSIPPAILPHSYSVSHSNQLTYLFTRCLARHPFPPSCSLPACRMHPVCCPHPSASTPSILPSSRHATRYELGTIARPSRPSKRLDLRDGWNLICSLCLPMSGEVRSGWCKRGVDSSWTLEFAVGERVRSAPPLVLLSHSPSRRALPTSSHKTYVHDARREPFWKIRTRYSPRLCAIFSRSLNVTRGCVNSPNRAARHLGMAIVRGICAVPCTTSRR